jgi:L-lactate dehydrogenase
LPCLMSQADHRMQNPEKYVRIPDVDCSERRKIAVIGSGTVGATFAFALMISGLPSSIVLIDVNAKLAEGHAMDLNHGLPFAQPLRIYPGTYSDCKGADIVVITAGAAQKPGESRLDLVRKNTEIFKQMIPEVVRHNPRILLIVSNPVDILTYVALKVSGYPMNRVMGSGTVLDTARFRSLLGINCRVDPRNVHAYIVGEHGDSEVPVWSQVNIGGISFSEYCTLCQVGCPLEKRDEIFAQAKEAAYEIIDRKGATNFAIALALVKIVGAIFRDENSVLTVSSLLDDYYGISDACLSIPVIVNRQGVFRQLRLSLDKSEVKKFRASAEVLKEITHTLAL